MTENEAIEKLNMLDEALNFQRHDADECSCDLQMAIQALEKQIPKKMERYQCPECRHYFEDGEPHKYCPCCGQRLE